VPACAERGVSAPPEVAFNTATDPDRLPAWLPSQLGMAVPDQVELPTFRASWTARHDRAWTAQLQVYAGDAGGAMIHLEVEADLPHEQLARIAAESLTSLVRTVADNLTAG